MKKNILSIIGLVIVSAIAVIIDSCSVYIIFFISAMPIAYEVSPFLLLFLLVVILAFFIVSIVGLFKLKRWAYQNFFIITTITHSFLIYAGIFGYIRASNLPSSQRLGSVKFELVQFIPIVSLLFFIVYFLLPVVRRLYYSGGREKISKKIFWLRILGIGGIIISIIFAIIFHPLLNPFDSRVSHLVVY